MKEALVGIGMFVIAMVIALAVLFVAFFITGLCISFVEDVAMTIRGRKIQKALARK